MHITIVGSGNITHALVAFLGSKESLTVNILSSTNYKWSEISTIINGELFKGKLNIVTSSPEKVIPQSNIIIFTVPAFSRDKILNQINPFISDNTLIGSFPGMGGFNLSVENIISNKNINIFSAQRVPYIARIIDKGLTVTVTPKESINIAVLKNKQKTQTLLQNILDMQVNLLDDFLEVNLSNSNPILHSARLYELFKDVSLTNRLSREVLFYEEWNDKASEILFNMDAEFMQIVNRLKLSNIKSLKSHYEVETVSEMTLKMQSIEAFKGIKTPLIKVENSYLPDIESRYFTEDIEYGLKFIKEYADKLQIETPYINMVYNRLTQLMREI